MKSLSEKDCMRKYRIILSRTEKKIKNSKTTTSDELYNFGKKYIHTFKGVYMQDSNIKFNTSAECFIINTDLEGQRGEHWISIYKTKDQNFYIYDSFGRKSKKLLPYFIKDKKYIDADYDPEQMVYQSNCGQRCLAWLLFREKYGIYNALKI